MRRCECKERRRLSRQIFAKQNGREEVSLKEQPVHPLCLLFFCVCHCRGNCGAPDLSGSGGIASLPLAAGTARCSSGGDLWRRRYDYVAVFCVCFPMLVYVRLSPALACLMPFSSPCGMYVNIGRCGVKWV
mmetsp:Transcript_40374/g.79622  ORF Transcript_40374/g.79622 Transcript_40374/m.79622 type:complete len:131 (+) Transcript_40374:1036-1428(+)